MARPARDEASNAVIFQGANVTELGVIFGMERRDIQRKIYGVQPVAKRNGTDVWAIKDAAPHLVKPTEDMVARVLRMNHADLPGKLKQDYWNGEKARIQVEMLQARVWTIEQIVEYVSAAFKDIRIELQLLSDGVEREQRFTDEQRDALKVRIDAAMLGVRSRLLDTFAAIEAGGETVLPESEATQDFELAVGALAETLAGLGL